jgi:hypothetical protein
MAIRFRCTSCSQLMGIAERKAGTMVACPKCQAQVVVPMRDNLGVPASPPEPKKGDGKRSTARPARKPIAEPAADVNKPPPLPPLPPIPPIPSNPAAPPPIPASTLPPIPATQVPAALTPRPRKRRFAFELIFSAVAVALVTAGYVSVAQNGLPQPSGWLGHGLGVIGFLMMLCTETLYTLRKRARRLVIGRTSTWLHFHIFTGIVGSYLVLLHSGGKFNGLAGVLALLTVIMVISGFVGRYIYTAVPRTLDGVEVAVQDLEDQIASADQRLQQLGVSAEGKEALALATEAPPRGYMLVLGRGLVRWRQRRRLHRAMQHVHAVGGAQEAAQLEELLAERYRLRMQIHSLEVTRRLLALWHLMHIPLGGVLFTLAFIHIGAALYYATLLK